MPGPSSIDQGLILFCHDISVYSRRLEYCLSLRGFKYHKCIQPPQMPRPDLAVLGIEYRRIPILAIGRDIYIDTRLIIEKLEQFYLYNALGSKEPFKQGLEKIIESWVIEAGPFWNTAGCIPISAPAMNDPVWLADRKELTGGRFSREALIQGKAACLADLNQYYSLAEHGLLADGRKFIFDTEEPSLGDIHAIGRSTGGFIWVCMLMWRMLMKKC